MVGSHPVGQNHANLLPLRSSREKPQPNGYMGEERETILAAYGERSNLRLTHTFGVSCNIVTAWLKKHAALPDLSDTLRALRRAVAAPRARS